MAVAREYVDAARYDAAERLLGHVLAGQSAPRRDVASLGVHRLQDNGEEAAELMEQALAGRRGRAAAAVQPRRGRTACLGRVDEGLAVIRRAGRWPDRPGGHFNESMLRYERLEPESASAPPAARSR